MTDEAQKLRRAHLSVVPDAPPEPPAPEVDAHGEALWLFVRSARRDMARLLRAMQSSGRSLSSFPDSVITRLAHVDAVTARYLIEASETPDPDVRAAAESMRALESWVVESLSSAALADVRSHEIGVRIDDEQLICPLVRADWTGDDAHAHLDIQAPDRRSLRNGVGGLEDAELYAVCRRLGLRAAPLPWTDQLGSRGAAEQSVLKTLLDGHLLAILIATLPAEAHRLLAAIVRDELDESSLRQLAAHKAGADTLTADATRYGVRAEGPTATLCGCALAFTQGGRLWVPPELHRRIDGVLRAFGI